MTFNKCYGSELLNTIGTFNLGNKGQNPKVQVRDIHPPKGKVVKDSEHGILQYSPEFLKERHR